MIKKIGLAIVSLGALLPASAFAAADADVLNAASTTVNSLKENIVAIINNNISNLVVVGALTLAIFLSWRLIRRFAGGR
jgi:hypothetical protein